MADTELPITGYLDRFSHRPGETFTAHVSVRDGGSYRARLVRVLSGDPNPDGPGMRFEDLSHRFDQSLAGRRQPIHLGSYGVVGAGPTRDTNAACTWTVLVRPGARRRRPGVAGGGSRRCRHHAADRREWRDSAYRVPRHHDRTCDRRTPMQRSRWYRVWLAVDPTGGRVLIGQQPLDGAAGHGTRHRHPASTCRLAARC